MVPETSEKSGCSSRMVTKAKFGLLLIGLFLGMSSALLAQDEGSSATVSSVPSVQSSLLAERESAALPTPVPAAPAPNHHDTDRGEIDLGLGFSYLRFRSSPFNANTFGTNTSFTYFASSWIGIDGNISTGFGSQSSSSAMAKSVVYGAGVRVIQPRERRVRPWAHVLLGGIHMFPQTAFSNNGFAAQLGGGADYRLRYWLWLRVEGNYVHSHLYTQGQNNLQIASSVVYRFWKMHPATSFAGRSYGAAR
jgi:hypothetical protein